LVSAISIALFVGIPVAVIVGLGFVLNTFREQIVSSASATGSVFASIFTSPVTGFINQISGAFSDLPNINVNIPSLNIGGGGITIGGEDVGDLLNLGVGEPGGPQDIDDVPLAPDESLACRLFGIGCPGGEQPTPPVPEPTPEPGPMEEGPQFGGRFAESFNVQTSSGIQQFSFEELQQLQPGAVVGLFDVLGTQQTEFLPLNVEQVQASLGAGQRLRLSGQVFQDIRGIGQVEDLFA